MSRIPASEFDLSAVQDLILRHAAGLFQQWRSTLPEQRSVGICAPDETALIEEHMQCFGDALTALRDKDFSQKLRNWEHGFILGFVEGNLSARWLGRYLLPLETTLLKALWWKHALALVADDHDTLVRIEQLIRADLRDIAAVKPVRRKAPNPWLPDDDAPSLAHWQNIRAELTKDVVMAITAAVSHITGVADSSTLALPPAFSNAMPQLLADNFLTRT